MCYFKSLEKIKMKTIQHKIWTCIAVVSIGAFVFAISAQAQNFTELNADNDKVSDVLTNETVVLQNQAQPQYDPGPMPENELKKVMKPEEYEQFMAAKSYSDKTSTYTLGPTDVIDITVLRHPEVSGKYLLNSEGKIQYEFIGDTRLGLPMLLILLF